MRILSKFHDYYDRAMSQGIDLECIYLRETKEIPFNQVNIPYISTWKMANDFDMDATPILIGFAGKIYPMVKVEFTYHGQHNLQPEPPKFFDSAESYMDFIDYRTGSGIDTASRWSSFGRGDLKRRKDIVNYFTKSYEPLERLFQEHHVPVFAIHSIVRNMTLTLNPSLQKYNFFMIKDPFTTFQDIFMYQAGVLGNKEVDIVQIDDKHMLKQKGFDKFSFKTLKGDKKPRAKNRGKE